MESQFLRTEMMLGTAAVELLSRSHVMVFGLGGVGSWAVEALARSGVGALTLIDHDDISLTNLNRQLGALHSTIGRPKAEVVAERVQDINPSCHTVAVQAKYNAEHREDFFSISCNYIIDAIDLVSCKLDLIETALQRGVPIISALGTGNKLDPAQLRISDLEKTTGCPLARVVRKELRQRGIRHHHVLWSPEEPSKPEQWETPPPGRRSVPASVAWVPACAGLMLAGDVVQSLVKK